VDFQVALARTTDNLASVMTGSAGVAEVVTFGETMVLLLAEPGIPLRVAGSFRRSVAGAESNVAIGLARLGHRVAWFGRVGDDAFGEVVLRALRAEGVDTAAARVDPAPTGLLLRDCHADRGIDVIYHRAGSAGSRLGPADVDGALVGGARLLHLTGITPVLSDSARAATRAAVDAARAGGTTVSFDPNLRRKLCPPERAARVLRPLAARADIVLTGEDEAALLSGRDDPQGATEWFLEQGATLVATKAGAAGARVTDGTAAWARGALPVHAGDPVGAGDAFDAGFLSAWLRGLPPAACLDEGVAVAGMVVTVAGDTDGLPTPSERDAAVAALRAATAAPGPDGGATSGLAGPARAPTHEVSR